MRVRRWERGARRRDRDSVGRKRGLVRAVPEGGGPYIDFYRFRLHATELKLGAALWCSGTLSWLAEISGDARFTECSSG